MNRTNQERARISGIGSLPSGSGLNCFLRKPEGRQPLLQSGPRLQVREEGIPGVPETRSQALVPETVFREFIPSQKHLSEVGRLKAGLRLRPTGIASNRQLVFNC